MSDVAVIQKADALPAVQSESATILSIIERAARDPQTDISKMERLFEMHQKMQAHQAERAFNAAMALVQAELEPVGRGTDNKFLGTKYVDLAALAEKCTPIIAKHGFGLSFGTEPPKTAGHVSIVCDVTHSAGHAKRYGCELPLDIGGKDGKSNKTALQAFGSTTTYGRRYMMLLIFNVATAALDKDGNAPRGPRKSSAESKRDGTAELFNEIKAEIAAAINIEMLKHIGSNRADEVADMPDKWRDLIREDYETKLDELKARGA